MHVLSLAKRWPCSCKGTLRRTVCFPWESVCLWFCTCNSLGTQEQHLPSPLPSSQPPQEQHRTARSKPSVPPGYIWGFHLSALPLWCRSVCEQNHGANRRTRRFHFPGACHKAGSPPFQAQFFRPFMRLSLACCVIMLKKLKSSMSCKIMKPTFQQICFCCLSDFLNWTTRQ